MADPTLPGLEADRNLLVGALALQLNYIDRDALIGAMRVWAADKARPLEDIFEEQKILTPDRRAHLEGLVRERLRQNGDDAGRSLVGLAAADLVRRDLEQITDADGPAAPDHVSISVTRPPQADSIATRAPTRAAGGAAVPTMAPGRTAVAGARFRILRPHAKGGLGEVFVARDQELNREVALKEIQGKHADDRESRTRFLLEAEITGGLEHPGIVPVYGLGQYADGRPYYAMRFIRGDSLKEAVERFHKDKAGLGAGQRTMQLRGLLGRFVDVCNAIGYAHSRGVLHRDLKPGNVMLGKYGETLVVDWGLAKPQGQGEVREADEPALRPLSGSGATDTVQGSAVGTPQYMSPEQAAGRLDQMGPASDVYSLGATLYSVLTGRPPLGGADLGEVLKKVQAGDFPPPRRVSPDVPAALEAICLKAMGLKSESRYPNARALADDVEHWLADEPVSVYREPLTARLARSGARHRTLVTGTAALLITAVVALAVGTVLIAREQAKTEEQKKLAEENFQMAGQALDELVKDVTDKDLAEEPRMEEKRVALLMKARDYYRKFLEQRGDDAGLKGETALAHKRMGDILRTLEKDEEAKDSYSQAIRILTDLKAEPTYRAALGESYDDRGRVWMHQSKRDEARGDYLAALDVQKPLAADFPDRPEYRKELARTEYNLGYLYRDWNRYPEAETEMGAAITLFLKLVQEDAARPAYRQHLARCYLNLGPVLRFNGRPDDAEKMYDRAIELQTDLEKSDPKMTDYTLELGVTFENRGALFNFQGRKAEEHGDAARAKDYYGRAEESLTKARDRFTRLADQHGAVPVYRKELSKTLDNLAFVQAHVDRPKDAQATWTEALEVFRKLADEKKDEPRYQVSRWQVAGNLAWLLHRDEPAKARPQLADVIHNVQALLDAHPGDSDCLAILHDQSQYLAESLIALKEYDGAAKVAADVADRYRRNSTDYALAARLLCQCAEAESDPKLKDGYAKTAVELLRKGFDQGYRDAEELQKEPYKVLKEREDFRQLMKDMKAPPP